MIMFMMIMKILAMVLLVMPRYVCFLATNQHILLFDDVYNIEDDIGDGASGNVQICVLLFLLLNSTDDFDCFSEC